MTTETKPETAAKVGDFATYACGSDSYPVEIIAMTPKTITTRAAEVIHSGPIDGDNEYAGVPRGTFITAPNENGMVRKFSLRQDGVWRRVGYYSWGHYLKLGVVRNYRDPSF